MKSEKGEKTLWLHLRQALFPITPHGIGTFGVFPHLRPHPTPGKFCLPEKSSVREGVWVQGSGQISALLLNPKVSLGERVYL